jgi:hypothetical protein
VYFFCITIVFVHITAKRCFVGAGERKSMEKKTKVLKWKPHYALKYANAVNVGGGKGIEKKSAAVERKEKPRKENQYANLFI